MTSSVVIVVPTMGQRLQWLDECLRSIRGQDYPVTIIMIAPRNSIQALGGLAASHEVVLEEQQGDGLSQAINQGWKHRADYVAWLGDDDLLAPGSLNTSIKALDDDPTVAMVYGRCRVIDDLGATTMMLRTGRLAARMMSFGPDLLPQPGSLARWSAVAAAGPLNENLTHAMDLDLFLRLRKVGKLKYVPQELASFRRHPTSLTVSNANPGSEADEVRLRHASLMTRVAIVVLRIPTDVFAKAWSKYMVATSRRYREVASQWRGVSLVGYYLVGRWLPASTAPGGKIWRSFRARLASHLLDSVGDNINVERNAWFGRGRGVSLGSGSGIGINARLLGPVTIGNDVMMGPNVTMITTSHVFSDTEIPMRRQGTTGPFPVTIHDDVWIGEGVIILPGVSIGQGAIIGAGAVVTKDVAPFAIAVGNPARAVRSRSRESFDSQ